MKTKAIELTEQEAQVLINMINIAVKATGLDAVDAAKHFKDVINSAFASTEEEKEEGKGEEKLETV